MLIAIGRGVYSVAPGSPDVGRRDVSASIGPPVAGVVPATLDSRRPTAVGSESPSRRPVDAPPKRATFSGGSTVPRSYRDCRNRHLSGYGFDRRSNEAGLGRGCGRDHPSGGASGGLARHTATTISRVYRADDGALRTDCERHGSTHANLKPARVERFRNRSNERVLLGETPSGRTEANTRAVSSPSWARPVGGGSVVPVVPLTASPDAAIGVGGDSGTP